MTAIFSRDIEMPGCSLVAGDTEFPLTGVTVKGHVDGQGVVWIITQTFSNPLTEPAEAVYTFPLPHNGAVNGMKMRIAERIIEAVIKERGEAQTEYREAMALGQTAAMVEQERAEIFTTHVGNIHPGEEVSVEITIHATATIDGDEATLRLPMMVKERYDHEGQPDASNTNGRRVVGPISVDTSVTITFAEHVHHLVCDTVPSAKIVGQTVAISNSRALNTDIVLRWDAPKECCTAKWTPDTANGDEGTVEVTIRTEGEPTKALKKRAVSILLDRSGSMDGHYLEWARRIIETIVATLTHDDLVHALAFDDFVEAFDATAHGFAPADRATCAALLRELALVCARGGTELVTALDAVGATLGTLQSREHERIVVILTDGAYGDEAEAMRYRREQLAGARVITVAIGENANGFLDVLAADGTCIFVETEQGVAAAAQKTVSRISTPAHRHARLVANGLTEQAPHIAPDIYPRLVVRLTGRMKRPATGATVEVVCDDGTIAVVPLSVSADSSITTRWASQRIKALDADIMAETDRESVARLEKVVTHLSITHSVLSKYTAWLAVDRSRTTDTVIVRTLVQPDYALDEPVAGMRSVRNLNLRFPSGGTPRARRNPNLLFLETRSEAFHSAFDDLLWDAPDVSASQLNLGSGWMFATLVEDIRQMLMTPTITSEMLAEVRSRLESTIALFFATHDMKKLARALKRYVARCEKALRKGNQVDVRRHLSALADALESAER